MIPFRKRQILTVLLLLLPFADQKKDAGHTEPFAFPEVAQAEAFAYWVTVPEPIPIRSYFKWIDSLCAAYDTLLPYPLSEHLLIRANPWIIDSLASTDYYRQKEAGVFIYDQAGLPALRKGDSIGIPSPDMAMQLMQKLALTTIDVNIPEFMLRIMEGQDTLYAFPVRVGRNERKYLKMADRVVDLRTATGVGKIVRIERNPAWINPSDGKRYQVTRRDDGLLTACPQIPWLEPEINDQRQGHLIHPTTNPVTLGKAYSNGCVGTRESDAWYIYYHAPVGTSVVFRYDLDIMNEHGDTVKLKNIYGRKASHVDRSTIVP